jgi:predicted nucleic acid-binding protein
MSAVLIDSNVILDAILASSPWSAWSSQRLESLARQSRLVINPIIFAEVSVSFPLIEDAEAAMSAAYLEREQISFDAAFLAGKAFLAYRRRGGEKRSPLPDFFIGAHASVAGYMLLTRDAARYRTYFPRLAILAPDTHP